MNHDFTASDDERATASPAISVIVPVYNGAEVLDRCLRALQDSVGVEWECIVVDDGSRDRSADVARRHGAVVVETGRPRSGPGTARNLGAKIATAPLLCFVDSDVLVRPDTLAQFVAIFEEDPELAASFGSYDICPDAEDLLSQYRNLLHHFVHQRGHEAASTFWSGCGAIRRDLFLELGGFDTRYTRPSIEDIELGFRLRAEGRRIRLVKHIQVTHLKKWTFWGILITDIRDRALPWTALIVRSHHLPNDLNLDTASRASAISVFALLALVIVGYWYPAALLAALLPLTILLVCNQGLYGFLLKQRGPWFLIRSLPMHWLYYAYSAVIFAGASFCYLVLPFATPARYLEKARPTVFGRRRFSRGETP